MYISYVCVCMHLFFTVGARVDIYICPSQQAFFTHYEVRAAAGCGVPKHT